VGGWTLALLAVASCSSPEAGDVGVQQNAATAPTVFVQGNFACPQTPQTTVTVPFQSSETAGDLNVVVVGWNDTVTTISSVTDSKGTPYTLAIGPTQRTTVISQSIYYAKNVGAGANSVTVTFSAAAPFPDVRIAEYRGVDTVNPLDVAVGASGSSTSSNSGSKTTTNAADLLVGSNYTTTTTTGAGANFTSRMITSPDLDILEDRSVTATGSYSATAPMSSGQWVMQMVAFRAAVLSSDTQPPTAPSNLTATATSMSQVNLAWTASTDNVGVTSYLVERCQGAGCTSFAQIGTSTGTTFSATGLAPSTSYSFRVRASDAANNLSPYSNTASATTAADMQAPTAPSGLTATAASATQINLSWTAATDNVGVTNYLVERCQGASCTSFAQIGTSTAVTFSDSGLTAQTSYSYRVRATDAAANLGPYSNTATASTPFVDTQPPTAPTNLAANGTSSSQASLSWTAATDNVAVTSYLIERCQGSGCSSFAQVATATGTTFGDSGLAAQTSYSYRVRATDAAGNLGPYSNTATATTTAQTAPSTPTFVQQSSISPQEPQNSVAVSFSAAQTAGHLNVVVVGWDDTSAHVSSVTDKAGNRYALAIGPTQIPNTASQSIYYAWNIAGSAAGNTVTVSFDAFAAFPDIRILEYAGIDTASPLDTSVGSTGNNSISDTGNLVVNNQTDLLVAANYVLTSTMNPGPGFTSRVITDPDGDIVQDRTITAFGSYDATATLIAGGPWLMQMVGFRAAGSPMLPPDTTPPTASITSPAAGATLVGNATVNVSASDVGNGVASVQLTVDGIPVGAPDFGAPYTFTLDTTQFTNAPHSLGAFAVDFANNVGNATPLSVTIANDQAHLGQWSGLTPTPIVAVHMALLRTGDVMMWDGQTAGNDSRVWNIASNTFTPFTIPSNDFCTGFQQLPDGRLGVFGGHIAAHTGLPDLNIFDPIAQTWTPAADMANPRWYPNATELPDGRIIVLSGESSCDDCFVTTPEIYAPTTNTWSKLSSATFSFSYYPHVYILPNGNVLVSNTTETPIVSQVLNISAQTWTAIGGPAVDGGASAMYMPGKVLKSGTSVDPDLAIIPSQATAYVLDATNPSSTWRQVAPMAFARTFHTMTMLPNGEVLVTGGGPTTAATDVANAVLPAEIWSPVTETFRTVLPMHAPRLYHSTALLMPDARVLVTGSGRFNGVNEPTDQLTAEFYSPPYLFNGPRPVITSAPATLTYGQPFTVQTPDAARIASVALIKLGADTHSINMGQFYSPVSFTAGSGSLTVTPPANGNTAPPGYYMLFILDGNGVPSVASIVKF
jgi:chitodextrinase